MDDDDILFDDSIYLQNNIYIELHKLNDFFQFDKMPAVNIMHINCRSIKKNFNGIVNLVSTLSRSLTAIALTETWLTVSNQDTYM